MTTDAQVREFLRRLKAPAPEVMRAVFTRGGCYALSEILQAVFPEAESWQSMQNGSYKLDGEHVVTRICGKFYDILGRRDLKPCGPDRVAGGRSIIGYRMKYRRMTPAECRKARKWKCSWSYLVNGEPPVRVDT